MGALDQWKEEIDEPIRKAHENVECWHAQWGATFSGHVKVGTSEETAQTRGVGNPALAAAVTRLSGGIESASAVFAERDRLRALAAECGDIMPSPSEITQRAVALTKEVHP